MAHISLSDFLGWALRLRIQKVGGVEGAGLRGLGLK